jgi:hypothetical protein
MTERDRRILLLLYERHEWNKPLPGRANPQDHDTQLSEQELPVSSIPSRDIRHVAHQRLSWRGRIW